VTKKVEALKKKLDGEKSVEKDLIAVNEIQSKIVDAIEKSMMSI
jgi:hypothetical protein